MSPAERTGTIRAYAPAKLNLYLDVVGKRDDDYHNILTVMQTINLVDDLDFRRREDGRILLHSESPDLPSQKDNLVVRAANLLKQKTGTPCGADIWLTKRIPLGGGLGGGSSDCACTLENLDRLWNCGLSRETLGQLALKLGSDVPFFLHGKTAICRGRGEKVTPIRCTSVLNYTIVTPPLSVSTAQVYRAVSSCLTKIDPVVSIEQVRDAFRKGDASRLGTALHNSLSAPAFRAFPEFENIMSRVESMLYKTGCTGAAVSGSGSTIFGIFKTETEAKDAAECIAQENPSFRTSAVKTF